MATKTRTEEPGRLRPVAVPGVRGDGGRGDPDHVRGLAARGARAVAARRRSRACGRSRVASSGPSETLDEAATRELAEETGVDVARLLTQFGAYGDPGRDPRMNVVTVALPRRGSRRGARSSAGTDAAAAALLPVSDVLNGEDRARVRPPADRARRGRARARRARAHGHRDGVRRDDVHPGRAAGGVRGRLGRAARRRQLPPQRRRGGRLGDPDRRRARPGPAGGRPAELYRAGGRGRHGGPIHRSTRTDERN